MGTDPKNTFEVIGTAMEQEESMQIMLRIGQFRAMGAVGAMTSALAAREIKRLKQEKAYKAFGLDWEQFCGKFLGISRPTADAQIKKLEEFGDVYFALADITRMNPSTFRAIEGAITDDGALEFGNEVVPIDAKNAGKVREIVEHFRDEIRKEKQRSSDARHDAKEERGKRKAAEQEAKRAREKHDDFIRKPRADAPGLDCAAEAAAVGAGAGDGRLRGAACGEGRPRDHGAGIRRGEGTIRLGAGAALRGERAGARPDAGGATGACEPAGGRAVRGIDGWSQRSGSEAGRKSWGACRIGGRRPNGSRSFVRCTGSRQAR